MNARGGQPPAITLLYVPADRPDRVAKALTLDADVVIVDLEDAVAPNAKDIARRAIPQMLESRGPRRVQVRVNGLDTPWGREDLVMVASELDPGVEIRMPKVDSPGTLDRMLALTAPDRQVHCLLETAAAVERAYDIARHSPLVASIALGEQDLRSALGITDETALDWARGRVVVAAAAAGLPAPTQSVWTRVADLDGLARSCRDGRSRGFVGRCAIHPAQLPVIREAFRPGPEEVRRASELLRHVADLHATAVGAAVTREGNFVDAAMVAGAERILQLHAATSRDQA